MKNKNVTSSPTFWVNVASAAAAQYVHTRHPEYFTPEMAATWLSLLSLANLIGLVLKK